jgi:hypothetical protein
VSRAIAELRISVSSSASGDGVYIEWNVRLARPIA